MKALFRHRGIMKVVQRDYGITKVLQRHRGIMKVVQRDYGITKEP